MGEINCLSSRSTYHLTLDKIVKRLNSEAFLLVRYKGKSQFKLLVRLLHFDYKNNEIVALHDYKILLTNETINVFMVSLKKLMPFIFKLAANLYCWNLSVPMCTANMRWLMIAKVQFHSNFYNLNAF